MGVTLWFVLISQINWYIAAGTEAIWLKYLYWRDGVVNQLPAVCLNHSSQLKWWQLEWTCVPVTWFPIGLSCGSATVSYRRRRRRLSVFISHSIAFTSSPSPLAMMTCSCFLSLFLWPLPNFPCKMSRRTNKQTNFSAITYADTSTDIVGGGGGIIINGGSCMTAAKTISKVDQMTFDLIEKSNIVVVLFVSSLQRQQQQQHINSTEQNCNLHCVTNNNFIVFNLFWRVAKEICLLMTKTHIQKKFIKFKFFNAKLR